LSKKLLLADDSVTAQNMAKNILADAGYEVLTVSSAADALAELPEFEPDVLILDIYMQGAPSGLALCEQLRNSAATASVPVILAVGKMELHDPAEVARVRADALITKPFEATELVATVKAAMELASARPRPDYQALGMYAPAMQLPVTQLWPASAVAKITGNAGTPVKPMASMNNSTVITAPPEFPERDLIAKAVERVIARRMPAIIAEVIAELEANRGTN
jgi:DNA-binding response OmpR family regulator